MFNENHGDGGKIDGLYIWYVQVHEDIVSPLGTKLSVFICYVT